MKYNQEEDQISARAPREITFKALGEGILNY